MTTALRATAARSNTARSVTAEATLDASGYRAVVRAGALVVDIRSRAQRERQGVLAGATSGPTWLSGGPLGPEGSVVAVLAGLIASVAPSRRAAKLSPITGLAAQ